MTPSELIAWHGHQITFFPETDNTMVKHHRDAMHCIERLRAERDALVLLLEQCANELWASGFSNKHLREEVYTAIDAARKGEA